MGVCHPSWVQTNEAPGTFHGEPNRAHDARDDR